MSEIVVLKIVDKGGQLITHILRDQRVHPLDLLRALIKAQAAVLEKCTDWENEKYIASEFEQIGGSKGKPRSFGNPIFEGIATLAEIQKFLESWQGLRKENEAAETKVSRDKTQGKGTSTPDPESKPTDNGASAPLN